MNELNSNGYLMLSVAGLFHEHCARRALRVRVALVGDWMVAGVAFGAGLGADWRAGTAVDRRVNPLGTAVAVKLLERDIGTRWTSRGSVAGFFASTQKEKTKRNR